MTYQGYAADQGANQGPEVPRTPVTRVPNPQEDSEPLPSSQRGARAGMRTGSRGWAEVFWRRDGRADFGQGARWQAHADSCAEKAPGETGAGLGGTVD